MGKEYKNSITGLKSFLKANNIKYERFFNTITIERFQFGLLSLISHKYEVIINRNNTVNVDYTGDGIFVVLVNDTENIKFDTVVNFIEYLKREFNI